MDSFALLIKVFSSFVAIVVGFLTIIIITQYIVAGILLACLTALLIWTSIEAWRIKDC